METYVSFPVTLHPAQLLWNVCNWFVLMHSRTHCAFRTILPFFPAYCRQRFCPDGLCGSTTQNVSEYAFMMSDSTFCIHQPSKVIGCCADTYGMITYRGYMERHCILVRLFHHVSTSENTCQHKCKDIHSLQKQHSK